MFSCIKDTNVPEKLGEIGLSGANNVELFTTLNV